MRFPAYVALLVLGALQIGVCTAVAVPIQRLTTASGIPVWLVETHGIPLVSARVAFRAGAAYDPEGKEGAAMLTASLLNESVDGMDAREFAEHIQGLGATLRVYADDDVVALTLQTLTESKASAFDALGKAVTRPSFEREDARQIRDAMLADIKKDEANPAERASRELRRLIYGRHPYGHSANGQLETVSKLTARDARTFYKAYYTRSRMAVSIVGDVTPEEALKLVDAALSDVPAGDPAPALPPPFTPPAQYLFVERDIPQTHLRLGHLGIGRDDADYPAAQVLNYVLGGGGLTSRLMKKIRSEKGLAYGVRSHFEPNHVGGTFEISAQTGNDTAQQVIAIIKDQVKRLRAYGVEAEEFRTAVDYLQGSFPLTLANTENVLGYLTIMQMENLGADYLDNWPKRLQTVTREDVFKAANRLLDPAKLVTVAVGGKPAAARKDGD